MAEFPARERIAASDLAFVTYNRRLESSDLNMQKIIRSFSGRGRRVGQGVPRRPTPGRERWRGAVLLLGPCLAVLAACGEDEASVRKPAARVESSPESSAPAIRAANLPPARDWLERADPMPPEIWLAGRSVPPADPTRMAVLLREADGLFDEAPRMLANRTAQLQRMLAEKAVTESPQDLLEGFIRLAREDGRTHGRPGFSDLCQHYYNLRESGLDRAAALEALVPRGQGSSVP